MARQNRAPAAIKSPPVEEDDLPGLILRQLEQESGRSLDTPANREKLTEALADRPRRDGRRIPVYELASNCLAAGLFETKKRKTKGKK